ncbi:hypothetical protein [Polaribacter septentrionalilitoris]|uniref:hypothetical protein n=1 Tax=Polaribacter septentrionalilitoris TaxID=2494657 RepID=UPI001357B219|nr:hypothetical protein [Polaribacter septentrionalilitoris]
MNEKEIIEKIDLLFEKITDFNTFSINNIFFKEIKPDEKNKDEVKKFFDIVNETKLFGMNNDLFEKYNDNGWFSLTEKGKELKLSNFGYNKFTKKSKPKKFDLYKIIPIILTIVFGSLNIYQKYDYRELKNNYDSLKFERDSLKQKLTDLNNKTVEYKVYTLTDTLKTKKESE